MAVEGPCKYEGKRKNRKGAWDGPVGLHISRKVDIEPTSHRAGSRFISELICIPFGLWRCGQYWIHWMLIHAFRNFAARKQSIAEEQGGIGLSFLKLCTLVQKQPSHEPSTHTDWEITCSDYVGHTGHVQSSVCKLRLRWYNCGRDTVSSVMFRKFVVNPSVVKILRAAIWILRV